jgi:hypothetical protein
MSKLTSCAVLLAFIGVASAEQPKPAAKAAPAAVVKTPPLPPQLDGALFADPTTAKWDVVASLPKGAMGALIGTDAADGGMAGWLKLPAGYRIPPSWDTHRATYTVVSGQLTLTSNGEKHVLPPGGFAVVTSNDKHEIKCGPAECLILVQHYGPPDSHWVNPADAPKAR